MITVENEDSKTIDSHFKINQASSKPESLKMIPHNINDKNDYDKVSTLSSNINHKKNEMNKLQRYKIGLIFYLIYVVNSIFNFFLALYFPNLYTVNCFSDTYIHLSCFIFAFFFSFLIKKFASKNTKDMVNVFKYYVPDWKKNMSSNDFKQVNSSLYVFEGTKEKFQKNIHLISFTLMIALYFSYSFLNFSYREPLLKKDQYFLTPLSFPLAAFAVILILRKLFLNTQKFDFLGTISMIILIIGIITLFIFQSKLYSSDIIFAIYNYSTFGGIFFGFFSISLKYFYNLYSVNFKISTIFGYIGLYTLITMPIILCIGCIWSDGVNIFELGGSFKWWCLKLIVNVVKVVTTVHCILGLSPLVFGMGMFIDCLINITLNIATGKIKRDELDELYWIAAGFILVGILLGGLEKFLKNKIIEKKKKKRIKDEQLGEETKTNKSIV